MAMYTVQCVQPDVCHGGGSPPAVDVPAIALHCVIYGHVQFVTPDVCHGSPLAVDVPAISVLCVHVMLFYYLFAHTSRNTRDQNKTLWPYTCTA